jgi:hypothetical protein
LLPASDPASAIHSDFANAIRRLGDIEADYRVWEAELESAEATLDAVERRLLAGFPGHAALATVHQFFEKSATASPARVIRVFEARLADCRRQLEAMPFQRLRARKTSRSQGRLARAGTM